MHNIEDILKKTRPEKLSDTDKGNIWTLIDAHIRGVSTTPISAPLGRRVRRISKKLIAITTLVGLLLSGTTATVFAANNSKPGDLLYGLNIATENARIALASTGAKDDLRVTFAEKRLSEASDLFAKAGIVATSTATSTASLVTASTTPKDSNAPITFNDQRAVYGYEIALQNLSKTRSTIAASGNTEALSKVDDVINRLTNLASQKISNASDLRTQMVDKGESNVLVHIRNDHHQDGKLELAITKQPNQNASPAVANDDTQKNTGNDGRGRGFEAGSSQGTATSSHPSASTTQTTAATSTSTVSTPDFNFKPSVPAGLTGDDENEGSESEGEHERHSYIGDQGASVVNALASSTPPALPSYGNNDRTENHRRNFDRSNFDD